MGGDAAHEDIGPAMSLIADQDVVVRWYPNSLTVQAVGSGLEIGAILDEDGTFHYDEGDVSLESTASLSQDGLWISFTKTEGVSLPQSSWLLERL